MAIELMHWDIEQDGEVSETAMRKKLEDMGYSVNCYVYPPGTVFPAHTHGVHKIDGVLSGRFLMRMEGESIVLQEGDMLVVPRGVVHSAEVVGDQSVVSLDAIKY